MSIRKLKNVLQTSLHEKGYSLIKSTARKWSFDNQCGYMIVDISNNACVAGNSFDFSLDDVKAFLEE